jgi:hypothetical protein
MSGGEEGGLSKMAVHLLGFDELCVCGHGFGFHSPECVVFDCRCFRFRPVVPQQPTITDMDKLRCARRELALRRNVYPRHVERGRMSREAADREIKLMEAIVADYEERMKS